MSIFDMGKNLKDEPFSIDVWKNPCGEIALTEPEPCQLTGNFSKKRGRPKMTETFFYDPYENDSVFANVSGIFMGIDVGSVITSSFGKSQVVEVMDNNTLKVKWEVTYAG